jgi:hypothetical protein
MANLRNIFLSGINTIFSVFEDAVKIGTYNLDTDNGFDDVTTESDAVRCIFEKFTEKDIELLTFSDLIQPSDVKGLIPAEDITLSMNTKGYCVFDGVTYTVEGQDLDPMSVIYTLLLRKT